jgi:hypothetical protein
VLSFDLGILAMNLVIGEESILSFLPYRGYHEDSENTVLTREKIFRMHMLNIRLVSRMYYKSISKNFTHQKWVKF